MTFISLGSYYLTSNTDCESLTKQENTALDEDSETVPYLPNIE